MNSSSAKSASGETLSAAQGCAREDNRAAISETAKVHRKRNCIRSWCGVKVNCKESDGAALSAYN